MILLPLLYLLVSNILPPDYSSLIQYMYTQKLDVSVQNLAIIDNVGNIVYYFVFLWIIDKLKGVPLWKLFVLGNLSKLIVVLQISVFFDLPIWM
jgi:hypothetical protein